MVENAHKLCLGTAALGLENYGVANKTGKPNAADFWRVMDAALCAGVEVIDTATAYGDAEQRLGDYPLGDDVRVVTKLQPNVFDDLRCLGAPAQAYLDVIRREFDASAARLGVRPMTYLLHSSRYVYRPEITDAMRRFGEEADVEVGVSCYEPDEVVHASYVGFTVVQAPYSILDRRCEEAMAYAKARGLTVYARAPFVQGLLFLEEVPERFAAARDTVASLRSMLRNDEENIASEAIRFVASCPYVDYVVFGAETLEQVLTDVTALDDLSPQLDWLRYRRLIPATSATVVNPSLWAKP